jgi:release factor glutamine methyltransferase
VPGLSAHRIVLQLTEEQRDNIRQRTGIDTPFLAMESHVSMLRCCFAGVSLQVARGVFPPQPASEEMVRAALRVSAAGRNPILIDVGTGCGAIALALAAARPNAVIYASDVSSRALRCARRNRRRLKLRVNFRTGSLLEPIPRSVRGRATVVVGNVPYVPSIAAIHDDWPAGTAYGEDRDGLGLVRKLAAQAREVLCPGGSLIFQIAGDQWSSFAEQLTALSYQEPQRVSYNGPNRACVGSCSWLS